MVVVGMGGLDQYTSQFLMRERIGPSQADGNPALPGVVFLHRLSAGYQIFRAALCNSAPTGERLLWQQLREIQIFTFIAFPAFTGFLSRFPRSTRIPPSLNILYITGSRCTQAWRIMAARPSPLPSFNHPQTASVRQLILHLTHSAGPGSSAVCYYALALCALHFSHEKRRA